MFLRNVFTHLKDDTVSQPRLPQYTVVMNMEHTHSEMKLSD